MPDVAIISKRIITPSGIREGVLLLQDGKIADIINELGTVDFPFVDVGTNVVMAGIIDPHVHINEPGRTNWEGFDTATKAALAGGITTLIDMPLNASPVTTTAKAFLEKQQATIGKLHAHCGFWGGIIPGNEAEIEPLIEQGVRGFKAFLTHSGIDEFPNVTEADLRKAMPIIAKHDLPLLVHCELDDVTAIANPEEPRSYSNYLASRPAYWEDNAIALMIRLCAEFNCRTHIVHLSSAQSIAQIKKAKQQGIPLTVETGQHYLYFNAEDIPDGLTAYKCAPPIRGKVNNEKLWQALKEGIIDFVATDHSPAPPALKEINSGNLLKAWGGIASIQFALPVLWTAAKRHGCSLENIAQWLCEKPALLPGLDTRGKIVTGYSADITIWNPEETFIVSEEKIHHRHKITPYLDEELSGVVKQTWLNGELVFDEGKFLHLNRGELLC